MVMPLADGLYCFGWGITILNKSIRSIAHRAGAFSDMFFCLLRLFHPQIVEIFIDLCYSIEEVG